MFGIKLFGKIRSFETVTLRTSGMLHVTEYEIVMKDGRAELSQYAVGRDVRKLQRRAVCGEDEVLKLLNRCSLLSWDGFYGPHPKRVMDGTAFTLDAAVNKGKKIHASGSQNFPRHYRKLTDGLYGFLENADGAG
ncbi:MAG: hypothetical protein J5827_02380 [Oscillospiraceae bacterium]|nr:hypothetical protein [Oscillospiraceae bacterium]